MIKRLLSATLAMVMLTTGVAVSYGDEITSNPKKTSNIEITNSSEDLVVFRPEKNLTTSDKTILLSGTGKKDSKVIIEVYSVTDTLKDKYSFDKLPKDDDYLNPVIKEITVGPFGIFLKELELKLGINRICIYTEGTDKKDKKNIIEKYVYVNDKSKANEIIENISSMGFSDVIKEIFKGANSKR